MVWTEFDAGGTDEEMSMLPPGSQVTANSSRKCFFSFRRSPALGTISLKSSKEPVSSFKASPSISFSV